MSHSKIEKTNAARLLDRAKIAYELVPYRVDEEHLAATHVAEQLGEEIACVFKTLVLKGDRTGYFVCVVPGNHEVDLKAAARVSGNKKVDLIPMKELLPVTGYIRGGCSPIGMKKSFPTYIHASGEPKRYTPDDVVDLIDGDPALLPALLALFRQSIGSGNPVFQTAARPENPEAAEVGHAVKKIKKSPTGGSMP